MSFRDTLTLTRVSSLRSSPNRSNLLTSVSETCEEDWELSGSVVTSNCDQLLTENQNIVQDRLVAKGEAIVSVENKYCDNQLQEVTEISEPSIKGFLAKNIERSKLNANFSNSIPDPMTIATTDIGLLTEEQDALSQTCNRSNLTEIKQLREKISSEMLSIDPLTRKKISSLQHCSSFDHADSEDEVAAASEGKKEVVCTLRNRLENPPDAEEEGGSSEDEDESLFVASRSRVTRNPSYQRAVTKACKLNRFSIDVAVSDENSSEGKGPSHENSKEAMEPQNAIRSETSNSSQITSDTSVSANVSRSVSFNERILETTKIVDSTLSSRSNSSASRKDESISSSSTRMIRQMSTPTAAKPVPNLPYNKSFDIDVTATGSTSDSNSQRKMSLKTITSNFSKKFTSKSSKAEKKLESDKLSYPPQMVNGVPPTESSAAVVSYEGLLRLFECPGCQTLMLPPFLQCKKGHLLCDKCKVTFKGTCPQCKQRIADSTNYMMEQVCNLVRFPCKFGQFGCSEFYPPRQKTEHEHFCHHRPVHCHFEGNGCTKILPLKDMKQHLDDCQWKSSDHNP